MFTFICVSVGRVIREVCFNGSCQGTFEYQKVKVSSRRCALPRVHLGQNVEQPTSVLVPPRVVSSWQGVRRAQRRHLWATPGPPPRQKNILGRETWRVDSSDRRVVVR